MRYDYNYFEEKLEEDIEELKLLKLKKRRLE